MADDPQHLTNVNKEPYNPVAMVSQLLDKYYMLSKP